MARFSKAFKIGTKVKFFGDDDLYTVKSINSTRNLLKVYELVGSFQRGHIERFTNTHV